MLKAGERKLVAFELCKGLADCPRLAVTRGITALEYAQRRSNLAAKLPKNSFALLAASEVKYRSGAVFYEFHQDSNFFYLTGTAVVVVSVYMLKNPGFNEPEAVAVIGRSSAELKSAGSMFIAIREGCRR